MSKATEINIIGDVAGQLDALKRLLSKMPPAPFLCVGDLIDRGPDSKGVIDFVRKNGRSLMGNHEHMMMDFYFDNRKYEYGIWLSNGGRATMANYCEKEDSCYLNYEDFRKNAQDDIRWIANLPMIYQQDGLIVTHAPLRAGKDPLWCMSALEGPLTVRDSVLWNRNYPSKRDEFQVFGHNSYWGVCWFNGIHEVPVGGKPPEDAWATCLDDSYAGLLTGMHWPSKEIFQVSY